jgi:hypothetical protein
MQRALLTALCLVFGTALPAAAAAGITLIPSSGHEPVKFSVLDPSPQHYTIDVKKFTNLGVNQEAPTFVMYDTPSVPSRCGDFSHTDIDYQKPDKYHRIFDLTKKPEVLWALDRYGCVVIPNKPKYPAAKS